VTGRLCTGSGHETVLVFAKAYPKKSQTEEEVIRASRQGHPRCQSLIRLPLVLFFDYLNHRQRIIRNAETGGIDANCPSRPWLASGILNPCRQSLMRPMPPLDRLHEETGYCSPDEYAGEGPAQIPSTHRRTRDTSGTRLQGL